LCSPNREREGRISDSHGLATLGPITDYSHWGDRPPDFFDEQIFRSVNQETSAQSRKLNFFVLGLKSAREP
jgi:hypothetical protein